MFHSFSRTKHTYLPALWFTAVGIAAFAVPSGVWAHAGHSTGAALGGFGSGFLHPILGMDHLLAMLAVGLWGAQMDGKAVWTLPMTFPVVMALGGALGVMKISLPAVETVIALSVLGLGLAIALAIKPKDWVAILAVSLFAIFHGHAHGTELPASANAMAYGLGFVSATGLIHVAGIGLGLAATNLKRPFAVQISGGLICATGVYFLFA